MNNNTEEKNFSFPSMNLESTSTSEHGLSHLKNENQKRFLQPIKKPSYADLVSQNFNQTSTASKLPIMTTSSIDEGFEDFPDLLSLNSDSPTAPRISTPDTPKTPKTPKPNWKKEKKHPIFTYYAGSPAEIPTTDNKIGGHEYDINFRINSKYLQVQASGFPSIIDDFNQQHPRRYKEIGELSKCLDVALAWANQAKMYSKNGEKEQIDQMVEIILEYHAVFQVLINYDLEDSRQFAEQLNIMIDQKTLLEQQNSYDTDKILDMEQNILDYKRKNLAITVELSCLKTCSKILRLLYKAITEKLIIKENENNAHPQNTYLHALKNSKQVNYSEGLKQKIREYETNLQLPKAEILQTLTVPNIFNIIKPYFFDPHCVLEVQFPLTTKIKDVLLRHASLTSSEGKLYLKNQISSQENIKTKNDQDLDWSRASRKIPISLTLPQNSNLLNRRKEIQKI